MIKGILNFPFSLNPENKTFFQINQDFEKILKENDLLTYDAWMDTDKGEVFRESSERQVKKIILNGENGKKYVLHLKKHFLSFKESIKSIIGIFNVLDGKNEWKMIDMMNRADIQTMVPVAFGERKRYGLSWQSFTVTEHLYSTIRLEDYIPKYLKDDSNGLIKKRKVIKKLALIVRRFHSFGFNHQDLYLGHFFINPEFLDIYLIDLQRVIRRKKIRLKDRVKDLGQLYYSASLIKEVSFKDVIRFFKIYSQRESKLTKKDRFLMKLIDYKKRRIESHIPDVVREKMRKGIK